MYDFQVDISCLGIELAQVFEKYPLLPGAILAEQDQFVGSISRSRLLEYLLHPHGLELFLNKPLRVLYSYARTEMLVLPESTPIVEAARFALRREPALLGEPIIVQSDANRYYLLNIHELNIAYWQIRGIETQVKFEQIQAQMIQNEKMASLGRLVDGVAHEILDPVGFIWGNIAYVSNYSQALLKVLSAYEKYLDKTPPEIEKLKQEIELDFLKEDLPQAIASIRTGAERLKKLVISLQNFCHLDEVYPKPADIHSCIDGVLLLLNSRLTGEIEIVKNYGHLPPVTCYIGQLSQVFVNILTNAIDALINQSINRKFAREFREAGMTFLPPTKTHKPRIEISTQVCSFSATQSKQPYTRAVLIRIADNGPGISPEKQRQILNSFSTEKRVEKETSLAVSYWIVTAKHGGKFEMHSTPGAGTEFEIFLPLV
ncbi:MAG TPA: sensor histidine kinase [Oscillatoriaceae cyanobacterium M7585_C2015_266]|nr:sensor histidine kinase [Oscillatoriaceae cyanobacterium M7585_C2015_266]